MQPEISSAVRGGPSGQMTTKRPGSARWPTTSALSPVESMKPTSLRSTQTSAALGLTGALDRLVQEVDGREIDLAARREHGATTVVGDLDVELTVLHTRRVDGRESAEPDGGHRSDGEMIACSGSHLRAPNPRAARLSANGRIADAQG